MAEPATKVPVKTEQTPAERSAALQAWRPLESLRREIDHLFENFDPDFWRHPSVVPFSTSSHSGDEN